MPRFTYHFNSFNMLFKAVPNLVQNIAFEKNIPVPTYDAPHFCGVAASQLLVRAIRKAA